MNTIYHLPKPARERITAIALRSGRRKRLISQRVVQDMVLLTVTEPELKSLSAFQCRCAAFDYPHVNGLSSRCLGVGNG